MSKIPEPFPETNNPNDEDTRAMPIYVAPGRWSLLFALLAMIVAMGAIAFWAFYSIPTVGQVYVQKPGSLPVTGVAEVAPNGTLRSITLASGRITAMAWDREGNLFAFGTNERTIEIWDVRTARRIHLFREDGEVASLAFGLTGTAGPTGKKTPQVIFPRYAAFFRKADTISAISPGGAWLMVGLRYALS